MKITKLETFQVLPRWCFLKISTDEGICGWGEPCVEGRTRTVAQAVHEFEPVLIGQDPRRVEHLWQLMYRTTFYRGGPVLTSCISGIEQALWDIKGKAAGLPVYDMLGGAVRERIRVYGHVHGETIAEKAKDIKRVKALGFNAMKTGPMSGVPTRDIESKQWLDTAVENLTILREAAGADMDIAIDAHGCLTPQQSIRYAAAIEHLYPMFLEEPCLPENVDALVRVAQSTTIPIATGERLFTRWGFREVLIKQAAVVLQPDICHCGGIFEGRKIAAMAELNYANVAPHNPLGPISLASCLQVDACTPNFIVQEHPGMENEWDLGAGYLKTPFVVKNGHIDVPKGPGLGIEVDENVVRERAYPGDWDTPRQFHADGSVAQW